MVPHDESFLSDLTTQLEAVYSLRIVVRGYTGPLIRLRRDTDNAERNFFAGGNNQVIQSEILDWAGAGSAFVDTWFDQVGNADGMSTVLALQPRITNIGVFESTVSSSPTISFADLSQIIFPANFALEGINARGQSAYVDTIGRTGSSDAAGQFGTTSGSHFSIGVSADEVRSRFLGCNRGQVGLALTDVVVGLHAPFNATSADTIITLDSVAGFNNLLVGVDVIINTAFNTQGSIGEQVVNPGVGYLGLKSSEIIFYSSLLPPAERVAVESEMTTYWKG